jgi:hypothetical protein
MSEHLTSLVKQLTGECVVRNDAGDVVAGMAVPNTAYRIDGEALKPKFDSLQARLQTFDLDGVRLDAGESALLARELLYVQQKQVFQQYTSLKSTKFIPVDSSIPAGTDTFSTEIYTEVGMAKLITNYATDFPMSDVSKTEKILKCFSFGNAFSWSVQDLRRSALTKGTPLDQRRASVARMVHDRLIDRVAALGDSATGLLGIANQTNVTILTAASEVVGDWATATAEEIFADLNEIESQSFVASKEVWAPDTLVLPTNAYNVLFNTAANDFQTDSIGKVWLQTRAQYVKNIDQWIMLNTAGASSATRAICYKRSAECLDQKVPMGFTMHAPQQEMLQFKVPCESRFGGTVCYYPQSMTYVDGL